ncbi:MAG: hypothetical protein AB7H77_10760 [Bdellovibrionales bacterium]
MNRFSSDSGIAIGPILFVLALLGVLAAVIGAGSSDFGTASVSDRIYSDVLSQANLIRTKINECNLKYGTNNNGDGWPPSDGTNGTPVCALICEGDPNTAMTGNDCAGSPMTRQNIWYGMRPALLPPPTQGFEEWYYMNAGDSGGRCIWTEPSGSASAGLIGGLTHAATKFSSQEAIFDAGGSTKRFVIWLTVPTGTADTHCTSP